MAVRFELLGVVPDTGTIPKMTSRYYRFLTSRVPRRKEREESCRLAGSDAFKAKRRRSRIPARCVYLLATAVPSTLKINPSSTTA